MSGIDESSKGPDWLIDLSGPIRQPMRDPRLDNARAALIEMQPQLIALDAAAKQVETALRDCADNGMTTDEIAVQISLPMDVVKRVLNGGSLLGSDYS
ncbi:hypothetical protein E3T61_05470 [Cryobacterium lactosi]|uniref:Uncharacterized protein n=1 Tax=Cryobacterium lactosi TaxID=1259202 RepID=A0A4R9BWP9_9MICO|nr:hypothetical protein [Cryobacterium lactosi]TFD93024.1 hypothetical protein E3T61_05470 [Cryobacterium lactosi]